MNKKELRTSLINLWITTKCNQQCNYCFARGTVANRESRSDYLSISDLRIFTDWLHNSPFPNQVQIMGGEPTQHPRIVQILEALHRSDVRPKVVLTNGLAPTNLYKHVSNYVESFLFSINSPATYTDEEFNLIKDNLSLLSASVDNKKATLENLQKTGRINLGITFYKPGQDYQYIIDLAKKYNIKKLRFSPAYPAPNFRNDYVTFEKLQEMKSLILDFVRDSVQAGLDPGIECMLLPCLFTTEEWLYLKKFVRGLTAFCSIPLELLPDLTIRLGACNFGELEKIDVRSDRDPEEIVDGWLEWVQRTKDYKLERCEGCELYENSMCQGDCLRLKEKAKQAH